MKQIRNIVYVAFALFAFANLGLLPHAHSVTPPHDGDYYFGNTAEGKDALYSWISGGANAAVGAYLTLFPQG